MPWPTGESFAQNHNKKLKGEAASTAAKQATAMVKQGVPEGIAIATANKTGDRMMHRKKSRMYDHPRSQQRQA